MLAITLGSGEEEKSWEKTLSERFEARDPLTQVRVLEYLHGEIFKHCGYNEMMDLLHDTCSAGDYKIIIEKVKELLP